MAGNTGKMTRDALEAAGPRMVLVHGRGGCVIFKQGQAPFPHGHAFGYGLGFGIIARSFTLSYLLRVGKSALGWAR